MFDVGGANRDPDSVADANSDSGPHAWRSRPSTVLGLGTCTVTLLENQVTSPNSKQQLSHHPALPHQAFRVDFVEEGLSLASTSILGTGGFGTVYSAKSPSGAAFALKVSSNPLSEQDLRRLKEEVRVMTAFAGHPNIVGIHCAALCGSKAYIAMERCVAKNLNDVLMSRPLRLDEFKWIGYQLVTTIADMHRSNYIHRDLKPQNLLFDADGRLKITDFGLSSKLNESGPQGRKTVAGTQLFMAPEIAAQYKKTMEARAQGVPLRDTLAYGAEIDVWSLGIVLFIMATRKSPYAHRRADDADDKAWGERVMDLIAGADWQWPDSSGAIDPLVKNLIEGILHRDRTRRPTIDAIVRHPVWTERPLTCPITLLSSLSLIRDIASPPAKLRTLAPNTPSIKKSLDEVVDAGARAIRIAEATHRAEIETEWVTFIVAVDGVETVYREQQLDRDEIKSSEAAGWLRLTAGYKRPRVDRYSVRASAAPRAKSVALGSSAADPSKELDANTASLGTIVGTSSSSVDIFYDGRSTATRWSLRPIVSVPRDVIELPREDRCLNNHVLRKITKLPQGYDGFDCDVCGSTLRTLSDAHAILRCGRCDYDVCTTCSMTPDANRKKAQHMCTQCRKRFISAAKLRSHTVDCRGPSSSPSRSSLGDSVEVAAALADTPKASPRTSSKARTSSNSSSALSRPSVGRPSTGMPVASVVEMSPSQSPPRRPRPSALKNSTVKLTEFDSIGRPSVYELPDHDAMFGKGGGANASPKGSSRARVKLVDEASPANTKRASSSSVAAARGERVSITTQRVGGPGGGSRGGAVDQPAKAAETPPTRRGASAAAAGRVQVDIRSVVADKPMEVGRRPSSGSEARGRSKSHVEAMRIDEDYPMPASARRALHAAYVSESPARGAPQRAPPIVEPASSRAHSKRPLPEGSSVQTRRSQPQAVSGPGGATHSAPRAPSHDFGAAYNAPHTAALPKPPPPRPAVPVSLAPPAAAIRSSTGMSSQTLGNASTLVGAANRLSGGSAYLALPQNEADRAAFTESFLGGAWIRHYAFASNDVAALYYCLQPGRCGALYMDPARRVMATLVLDIHSRVVLYVPDLSTDTDRREPHPHVSTVYADDVRLLSAAEAQVQAGQVLQGILAYISETNRLRAAGLPEVYVTAPYVHRANDGHVSRETKFAYLRKAFPDPKGNFCLFRLSNLRSQVIRPEVNDLEIRWQSDRKGRMGARYYVRADGTATPFTADHTGTLTRVEDVLTTVYHC